MNTIGTKIIKYGRRGVEFLRWHAKRRFLTGIVVLLPAGITLVILRFLFGMTVELLAPISKKVFGELPSSLLLPVSFLVFLGIIYSVGIVMTLVVGRRLVAFGEHIIMRLPLLRTVYGASKQVVETGFSSEEQGFRSVVLLEFPRHGLKSVGFVTGTIVDASGNTYYKVFIPTTPNPTSGFFQLVPQNETEDAGIDVDEAIKMIVSGGIIAPKTLG